MDLTTARQPARWAGHAVSSPFDGDENTTANTTGESSQPLELSTTNTQSHCMSQAGNAMTGLGLEPRTSGLKGHQHRTEATANNEVTSDPAHACTNACTESPESTHDDAREGDFGEALAMIARLPLSDDEKAEAVRRLLAGKDDARHE